MYIDIIHKMCCLLSSLDTCKATCKMYMLTKWQMSWWCHLVGPHDIMDDVMIMSWWCHSDVMHDVMMMWQSLHFILSLVLFEYASFWWVFGCSSSSTFVQVLNKNGEEFLLDKNMNTNYKKRKTHKPFIILAW